MSSATYVNIIEQLENFSVEYYELIEEINSHKEVTILRLKNTIDDRTKAILAEAKSNPDKFENIVVNHEIEIT